MQELFEHFGFKAAWSTFLSCFAWALGGLDVAVLALFILYAVDFALGLHLAWVSSSLSAAKARKGMAKFVLYVIVIACAHMLDLAMARSFPFLANYVRDCMVMFVAINEFLSVCTHLAAMGLRVPEGLQVRLRTYRDTAVDSGGMVSIRPFGSFSDAPTQPSEHPQPRQPSPAQFDELGGGR
ncbi:MAG: phage holin family protein [Proteobacteria bacterium]|nr:phage holin family protein [Pseudomonadota bacterium]